MFRVAFVNLYKEPFASVKNRDRQPVMLSCLTHFYIGRDCSDIMNKVKKKLFRTKLRGCRVRRTRKSEHKEGGQAEDPTHYLNSGAMLKVTISERTVSEQGGKSAIIL